MASVTVFLSSTGKDLAEHREAAFQAIQKLDGFHCIRMEDFGARSLGAELFDQAKVESSDLFIAVIGMFHGSEPKGGSESFTELEWKTAVEANIPRLAFISHDAFPLPANLREEDEKWRRQQEFRTQVIDDQGVIWTRFADADDLAMKVTQAIFNWREGKGSETATKSAPIERSGATRIEIAHPYPLQKNFTGRSVERAMLTRWLTSAGSPILTLTAMGGTGKTSLAWTWLQRDVLGRTVPGIIANDGPEPLSPDQMPSSILWWSFYEVEAGFLQFLDHALSHIPTPETASAPQGPHEKVRALVRALENSQTLLVLDGFERELRGHADAAADEAVGDEETSEFRSCSSPLSTMFLRSVAALPMRSRVLITSRYSPLEVDGLAGARVEELAALSPDDAESFFRMQGVKGTRAEIIEACEDYGFHPLALRLLSGVIVNDKELPGDAGVARRYAVVPSLKGKQHHHILEVAYNALSPVARQLLGGVAAFRGPATYPAVSVLRADAKEDEFHEVLSELIDRQLLLHDKDRRTYHLHPVVRQYAYTRLEDKASVHAKLRNFFLKAPMVDRRRVSRIDDLSATIELYHHTAGAGLLSEAASIYEDALFSPLFYNLGAATICIQLARLLFPDGEDKPPSVPDDMKGQIWNSLASAYGAAGMSRHALQTFQVALEWTHREGEGPIGRVLSNIAEQQILVGELADAEEHLREAVKLARRSKDRIAEVAARQLLGVLLAYTGRYNQSLQELRASNMQSRKARARQAECVDWICRAKRSILMRDLSGAETAIREAERFRALFHNERIWVDVEVIRGLIPTVRHELGGENDAELTQAEGNVLEALRRSRSARNPESEAEALAVHARWLLRKNQLTLAERQLREALAITERCSFRLIQADVELLITQLYVMKGNSDEAVKAATRARELARCQGPPHVYTAALDLADQVLAELQKVRRST